MNEITYKNRAMFKEECNDCKRKIYPGETLVTSYHDKYGNNINVLDAYKLPALDTNFVYHCSNCEN